MGELEGRSRRLSRRTRRLEEQAEFDRQAEQRAAERMLREGISRLGGDELRAMRDYFERHDREEWAEEDTPLMRRLLELKEGVRAEREAGDFPWRAEMRKE